jgi:PAS domain S-box-containing protein
MPGAMTSTFSRRRLYAGLAVQAVVTAIDVALSSNPLTITGAVLLVPLVLAVIGDWREVAITGAVAFAVGIASTAWNTTTVFSQDVYRVGFFTVFGGLAVLAARTRQQAMGMAAANESLAGELSGTRARLDGILGAMAEAVTVHDERGQVVYANPAAADLLGCGSVDEVLESPPEKLAARFTITDDDGRPLSLGDMPGQRLMAGEDKPSLLTRSIRDDGEAFWLLTKATLYRDPSGADLAINIIEDVTEAKDAELRERFLAEAGQLLASSLDYGQTLERVARMVVPRLADWCGIDMLDDDGQLQQVAVAHVDPAKVELAHDMRKRYPPDMDAPTGVPAILRGGPAEIYPDIPDELLVEAAVDDEHLRVIREVGLKSAMAVPMRLGDVTLGAISLVTAESGRRYDEDDLLFAQDLALRAATAVQNARLFEEQQRVARTLQASLLPERLPQVPGWEIHAAYHAGERGAAVGGDFYDVLPVEAGHLIVLGDVTGKGIEAAALTSLVRHSARMAARFDPRPARVLSLINDVLREQARLSLVTAVCALLEDVGGAPRLTVASAGHPLPLRRTADGTAEALGTHGVLLGVAGAGDWTEVEIPVEPGDMLLFYTDGVTETPGRAERFGEERLLAAMARADAGSEVLVATIERHLREFQTEAALDDRAMLAMRFLGVPATAPA